MVVFLVNLLISQLSCAYMSIYQDMLGFARLNRGNIVQETMPHVTQRRWEIFKTQLKLEERLEFGEGDLGICGGIQILESASANITTIDMICRFGGSTNPAAVWPEDEGQIEDDSDRVEQLEKLIDKLVKKMTKDTSKKGNTTSSGGGSSEGGTSGQSSSG